MINEDKKEPHSIEDPRDYAELILETKDQANTRQAKKSSIVVSSATDKGTRETATVVSNVRGRSILGKSDA